jgi:hypothetical protein
MFQIPSAAVDTVDVVVNGVVEKVSDIPLAG